MRCFIAIELPESIKEHLTQLSARLRRCPVRASWVRAEHMHLSLRFIGDADDDQRDTIVSELRKRLTDTAPFSLMVHGVGAFPNVRKPSIVWAGAGPLAGPLEFVQSQCEGAVQAAGFAAETKPFRPHVTLARVKDHRPPLELTNAIERERAFTAGEFAVRGVSLFKSELTSRGPVHTCLEEFPFAWS